LTPELSERNGGSDIWAQKEVFTHCYFEQVTDDFGHPFSNKLKNFHDQMIIELNIRPIYNIKFSGYDNKHKPASSSLILWQTCNHQNNKQERGNAKCGKLHKTAMILLLHRWNFVSLNLCIDQCSWTAIPGGHVLSNIWAGGQHTAIGCPPPNILPQNDQVLVLHFNCAFQIRSRRHFCIQHVNFFCTQIICSPTFKFVAPRTLFVFRGRPIV